MQIGGTDASQFSVTSMPASPLIPYGRTTFNVVFAPTSTGAKTATVSIANDDADRNPYTFNINGTATAMEVLTPDTWNQGYITDGNTKMYAFDATIGKTYLVSWDDWSDGTFEYTSYINVSTYRQDLISDYFENVDSGYTTPRMVTAQDNIIYIKVESYGDGTFAMKVTEIEEPEIDIKQGSAEIPNGTGSCDYGNVSTGSTKNIIFTLTNTGTANLNLTGNPEIQITGANASEFNVTLLPPSMVPAHGVTIFIIGFTPETTGLKNASVSIESDDAEKNPYVFTVTGTGDLPEVLSLDTWNSKNLTTRSDVNIYSFNATIGKTYSISWDDIIQGSETYSCDIKVSGYRQDLATSYFNNVDSGYLSPQLITAQDNIVYIKVTGHYSYSTGSFALKITEAP